MKITDVPQKDEKIPTTLRLRKETSEKIEKLKEKCGKTRTTEWLRLSVEELVDQQYKEVVG